MSETRNIDRPHWLPSAAALLVLSALLFCGQIAETAHAEVDCEHESCSLCVGSAADDTLVGDGASPTAPQCNARIAPTVSTEYLPASQAQTLYIRGPPTH